jgi:hypothetical protein
MLIVNVKSLEPLKFVKAISGSSLDLSKSYNAKGLVRMFI